MSKKKRNNIKRVGEIMEEMDTPQGSNFNLTGQFMENGPGGGGMKPTQALLRSFENTYEPVGSEHMAQELFTMGRLREYFQAWIVPRMPDPLPMYLDELAYMGYPMRTSFDGSPCIMVRYRGSLEVQAEEVETPDAASDGTNTKPVFVYTDDWEDDLSDIKPPFVEEEEENP